MNLNFRKRAKVILDVIFNTREGPVSHDCRKFNVLRLLGQIEQAVVQSKCHQRESENKKDLEGSNKLSKDSFLTGKLCACSRKNCEYPEGSKSSSRLR